MRASPAFQLRHESGALPLPPPAGGTLPRWGRERKRRRCRQPHPNASRVRPVSLPQRGRVPEGQERENASHQQRPKPPHRRNAPCPSPSGGGCPKGRRGRTPVNIPPAGRDPQIAPRTEPTPVWLLWRPMELPETGNSHGSDKETQVPTGSHHRRPARCATKDRPRRRAASQGKKRNPASLPEARRMTHPSHLRTSAEPQSPRDPRKQPLQDRSADRSNEPRSPECGEPFHSAQRSAESQAGARPGHADGARSTCPRACLPRDVAVPSEPLRDGTIPKERK